VAKTWHSFVGVTHLYLGGAEHDSATLIKLRPTHPLLSAGGIHRQTNRRPRGEMVTSHAVRASRPVGLTSGAKLATKLYTETMNDASHVSPSGLRTAVARGLLHLPAPIRDGVWRLWRAVARVRRRRLERKGNYSLSAPAMDEMDAKLAMHIDLAQGFFVEAGANDGYHQSNTYRLERVHGWRGVLIEPVTSLYKAARRERPNSYVFNCALVSSDYDDESVQLVYGGMMTTVSGARDSVSADRAWAQRAHAVVQEKPEHEFSIEARTISSILDEINAPEVDFLSLDVEGFEPQVLRGIDFKRHAPRWILVEIREGESNRNDVEASLGDHYAVVEQLSPCDILYRRVEAGGDGHQNDGTR
jgi:FkbM family methyltransferase